MKKTTYITAILAAAMFSGAAFAEMDNVDDVLTGNGKVSASPSAPYVWVNSGPQGIEDDILYGKKDTGSSDFSPYERLSEDRDNRDNLLDKIS
jgi:hypothetical protein